ncbi:right-handed parallel beta-helix repeat-containing protein [Cochleicola gelatinilyticus]|uniref:Right handed beta helix domain-containing protein n=1 Tax=Cochleicola gelatinilyticus TaxID=1763537 RepID=A0A167IL46_9FLAO|nr:right-handed parallel beta-helix repeat-containing protein [Cochleicola gelatinilyticus]OAB79776.1 hypothetical protein ULVI_03255 [Cochleicola gelatinilyticus]
MRIENKKKRITNSTLFYFSAGILLLVTLIILHFTWGAPKKVNLAVDELDTPTTLITETTYERMIEADINLIHRDSEFSIYANEVRGKAELIYVYKAPLLGRKKTDKFFLHLFINDSLKTKSSSSKEPFLGLDFFPSDNATEYTVDGTKYIFFTRQLHHYAFEGKDIPFNAIEYINTGRFASGEGRSHGVNDLKISAKKTEESINKESERLLSIYISEKSYNKIKTQRKAALEKGILFSGDDDIVKTKVTLQDENGTTAPLKADLRLKGDFTDHLKHPNKWSYRVILDGNKTLFGMRKFSVQHPRTRNYSWEWLFNKLVKDAGLIGLRYEFVPANLYIDRSGSNEPISMGYMAIEESFDKILIENNNRREGLILGFEESLIWNDRAQKNELNLDIDETAADGDFYRANLPIKVYNENKVLGDPKLTKQFETAKSLLEGVRTKKLKVSEVFDLDKLTTYVALANLFGGKHGLIFHNLRIYYNPVTGKLEPVSFDSNAGNRLLDLAYFPYVSNDTKYEEMLNKKLRLVSSESFIKNQVLPYVSQLEQLDRQVMSEFNWKINLAVLEHNSNFIKKKLNPSNTLLTSLADHSKNVMKVNVKNVSGMPIDITGLTHEDGKKLDKNFPITRLLPDEEKIISFPLNRSFDNAFVSKKTKKAGFRYPKDVSKLRIIHHIPGISIEKSVMIASFGKNPNLDENLDNYSDFRSSNATTFKFVSIDDATQTVRLKKGSFEIQQDLKIPAGYTVIIEPGFTLDLKNNASFISYSAIEAKGTKTLPITFKSSNNSGAGIFVTNTIKSSTLDHCIFMNLSNPTNDLWELSGAVNFNESEVAISNSVFEGNRCEDGLNVIRSKFSVTDCTFKNTFSDAFDGDFVEGSITNSLFINSGNDGIDVSGTTLYLENIRIENPSDKAISAGEDSQITGKNIQVTGGEIGIVSKDLSSVTFENVIIKDTHLALSAFQKKTEYGTGTLTISEATLQNNELDHLIETGSHLTLNNIAVETVTNNVIDKMYGNEYGKSSR